MFAVLRMSEGGVSSSIYSSRIRALSFLSKPPVPNSHYVGYLSSWSQGDDDDDSINSNNYYYYNGKDTWSELLGANHRSKPLPYFHSLNIHINP